MKLATTTIDTNTNPAPHWRTDPRLKDPARAVAAAEAAEADATARRDRASARILALDAELAAATDQKQADRLEDAREAAIDEEAKAARDVERARRARDRAVKSYEPLEAAAIKDCAVALRAAYAEKVAAVARTLGELKAQAADLDAFAARVRATIPEQEFPAGTVGNLTGLLRRDAALDFDTTLAAPRLLEKLTGRRGQAVDVFLARMRAWGLLR